MKYEKILVGVTVVFIIIMMIILVITLGFTFKFFVFTEKELLPSNMNYTGTNSEPEFSLLERVLRKEIIKIEGGECLDYATYYNKTISEKYPQLDIRWPRYVDICNNLTMCNNYHTFIIVAGYGGECIMDQRHIACVDILKTNQTKEELDKLEW